MLRPNIQLDYDYIKANADAYDNGDKSNVNHVAKLIWMAYLDGKEQAFIEVAEIQKNINTLLYAKNYNA